MKSRVVIDAAAETDISATRKWYNKQRKGLGRQFVEAVNAKVDQVAALPHAFPVVQKDVRRAIVDRFPYLIYFRLTGDCVEVIAVVHTRQKPDAWQIQR